ncbi:copper homeostasis protein CutC [Cellulophaga baltica]|uniref:copper homeostasis protein CutC n=1 Tax=Cellulophaga baltica TaxID=76594 RepID=UPI003F4ADA29
MLVEVCANSLESAINAEKAGADRIELCVELGVGGLTPSGGLLKAVRENIKIPVHVLIRPRSGDFVYSDLEFEVMLKDVENCIEMGVDGIVSGVLLPDFSIDIERTQQLIAASKGVHFTFHRAFDWVEDPYEALFQLEQIGVNCILSSGQQKKASEGISLLCALNQKAVNCVIMPGSGIKIDNALLFKENGFSVIHFSGVTLRAKNANRKNLSMSSMSFLDEDKTPVSDYRTIQDIVVRVK